MVVCWPPLKFIIERGGSCAEAGTAAIPGGWRWNRVCVSGRLISSPPPPSSNATIYLLRKKIPLLINATDHGILRDIFIPFPFSF